MSGGGFDKVYSILPLFVSGEIEKCDDPSHELIYSSLRKKGYLSSKFATIAEQISIFKRVKSDDKLWLYNIGILNVFLVLLLKLFKPSVRIYAIELDFTPPTRKICLMSFYLYLLNHINGVIKLASSPLFTNENAVILAGVTPNNCSNVPTIKEPTMDFLLSGVLSSDIASIPMILDAFAKTKNCRLHITGQGDNILLSEYANKYPNITYYGVLSFEAYQELMHRTTFILSLRDPNWGDNQCNFPSKIIEALVHNRIIVSTMHYIQIEGIKYIETERTVDGFVKTLTMISKMDKTELLSYANQSDLVKSKFAPNVWYHHMDRIENQATIS